MGVLGTFPNLRIVHFVFGERKDLMLRDLSCLRRCYEIVGHTEVVLNIMNPRAPKENPYDAVRINSIMLGQLNDWG